MLKAGQLPKGFVLSRAQQAVKQPFLGVEAASRHPWVGSMHIEYEA